MITAHTVFVLGAGASFPFGLPLGAALKRLVLQNYNDEQGHAVHLYNTTEFKKPAVREFVEGLRYSGLSSVDAFLERRPNFLEVGKATMGIELLLREVEANLWQDAGNWLTYLYQNMIGSSLEEFANNRVSFITFNYDRTLEHFLHTSLQNTFGRSFVETAKVVEQIPIIHLHGRLGFLAWQSTEHVIPFGSQKIDAASMKVMMQTIKVVHEDIADGRDAEFTRAKELIAEAKRVYLLGFGFGARNIERLWLGNVEAPVYGGTAYGMTQKEAGQCRVLCGGRVDLNYGYPALEFLRNVALLD